MTYILHIWNPEVQDYYISSNYIKSSYYKIIYTGNRYELYPTGMTVREFLEKYVGSDNYINNTYIDNKWDDERYLFGHNFYMVDVDLKEVRAHTAE